MEKGSKDNVSGIAPKVVKKRNGVTLSAIEFNVVGKKAIGYIEKFYMGRNGTAIAGLN